MKKILLLLFLFPLFLEAQSELDSWKLDVTNPIISEWELVDTMDLEIYTQYELWNEETTFIKEVPGEDQASPNDQIYYQAKLNLKTGEYYARVIRYTWKRLKLLNYVTKGSVKLRIPHDNNN